MHESDASRPTAHAVGARIRALREQKGWSKRHLAKVVAVTHPHIWRIEDGRCNTPVETLAAIARALGVPLKHFFDEPQGGRWLSPEEEEQYALLKGGVLEAPMEEIADVTAWIARLRLLYFQQSAVHEQVARLPRFEVSSLTG